MERGPLADVGAAGRVLIPRRFNGPPGSANGGYACGLVARHLRGPAEVTLRLPPPLDTALAIERREDGTVLLCHHDRLVAEGAPAPAPDVQPPLRPSVAEAREALRRHPWLGTEHDFRSCYVCGAGRHDGLGLHFGPLRRDPAVTAALLVADETVPHDGEGLVPELVWAALDCPSYVPAMWDGAPSVLGRMRAELLAPVPLGEPIVATGWLRAAEGRKHHTASALLAADGTLLARAQHVWIQPRGAA